MYFSYPPHKRIVTDKFLNPLHPKISMHILHTVLYTFPLGTDEENLLENQELLYGVSDHFLHSHGLNVSVIQG